MADERPIAPLPWEQKAAIGALVLLALQEVQEVCLLLLGSDRLGLAHLGPLAPFLFILAAGVGMALWRRRPWAVRICIYAVGALSLLHLAMLLEPLRSSMEAERGTGHLASTEQYWFIGPGLNPLGLIWALSRAALLIAAPLLLLLGELRRKLGSR